MKLRLPGVALAIVAIALFTGCTTARTPKGDSTRVASSSSPASSSVPVASIIANPIRTDADRVLDAVSSDTQSYAIRRQLPLRTPGWLSMKQGR